MARAPRKTVPASSSIIRTAAPIRSSLSSKAAVQVETIFGKQRYRAEDYMVIPRSMTPGSCPIRIEEEDYLILESSGPVRIPKRYLNTEGQIKMGAPYSERDFHGPTELNTINKEKDTEILIKAARAGPA